MQCENFDEFKNQLEHRNKRCPFKKSESGLQMVVHSSLDAFDQKRWNEIVSDESIFLHTDYLKAILKSYDNGLDYKFVCFFEQDELVGVAAFQITHFETSDLHRNIRNSNPLVKLFNKGIARRGSVLRFKMLICGNAFASGSHGFRFIDRISEPQAFSAILQAVHIIKESQPLGEPKISAVLLKDYSPKSFDNAHIFSDDKYSEFLVDPNMVMPIRASWENFADYLDALTSKYRTKAKAAFKRSAPIIIKEFDSTLLKDYKSEFEELYNQVHYKADFRVGKLNFEAFLNLKNDLGTRFLLRGLFLNDKLVGFMSGFEYNSLLDAHMVGIDYSKNYDYAIYSRMLYEYVDEAIKRKVQRISFGRTAMEIKSTVGAFPEDLKIFIKHRNKAPNHLLHVLFNYVKPADFDQRVPYKKKVLAEMRLLS